MTFVTAVKTCFQKYAMFSGWAPRSEYWWFALFNLVGGIVFGFGGVILRSLWSLALLVPGLAVAWRRNHDCGRSGWWTFTLLILPWGVVLMCMPSKLTNNKYVPDRESASLNPVINESSVSEVASAHCPTCGKLRLPGQNYCTGCGAQFE